MCMMKDCSLDDVQADLNGDGLDMDAFGAKPNNERLPRRMLQHDLWVDEEHKGKGGCVHAGMRV